MATFVRGVRIWDRHGVLRQSAQLEDGADALQPLLASELDGHVQRALAGHLAHVPYAKDADSLECTFAPLVNADGRPDGAIAVALDAVERRRTEATLRERLAFQELITSLSTQLVSLSVDAVDDGVRDALRAIGEFASVDRAYVFRFTSDGAAMNNTHEWCAPGTHSLLEMMQNLPLEVFPWWTTRLLRDRQLIHVPDIQALPPEAAAEKESLIEQGVKSILCLPMIYESAVVGFLGFDAVHTAKTWPEADVALLRIAGEIVVSALERKRAEDRRLVLETQLIQARSLEGVARLAGGVAHDFNNLLAVILNYAAMLRTELVDPKQQEQMEELYGAARRAAELTRELLLVGRRGVEEPTLLDVNTIVASLSSLLRQALGESIELRVELGDDLGLVRVGVPRLEQILLNVTLNARDAMAEGGGVLVIETTTVAVDSSYAAKFIDLNVGEYLRLRVTDTGTGMTADVASRAFEPFFTTKDRKGTGLGLSTVHGIVKQAGGHVALSSTPGVGTTVDVLFPIVRDGVATPVEAPPEGEAPKGRGEMVLVVEDSPSLRKLVGDMLTSNGYRAMEASTGHNAMKLLERHRGEIDLVLTDVIMPQMSGRDLATRATNEYGVARVLYMSGYPDDIIGRHGVLEAGIHLLPKPFLAADLLRSLRKVFDAS
jgi:signal transduction histidine kinase